MTRSAMKQGSPRLYGTRHERKTVSDSRRRADDLRVQQRDLRVMDESDRKGYSYCPECGTWGCA